MMKAVVVIMFVWFEADWGNSKPQVNYALFP